MSVSRRDFLKCSGSLIVSFSAASLLQPIAFAQGPFDTHPSHIDPTKLDSWIAIGSDGMVTAHTGKCDLGQGMFTVQSQLVAEELCVPIARVKLIQCDTDVCPDQGTTSGSQSTPTNFNSEGLAQAAATAREALLGMAATRFSLPLSELTVADGVITAKNGSHVRYEELIGNKHLDLPVSKTANRRTPSQWNVLGKPVSALDHPSLMTGHFEFVHNVRVDGMLHGRVVRPPTVGATLEQIDESSIHDVAGIIKVVTRKNFVGVVAEKQTQAIEAVGKLKITWKPGAPLPPHDSYYESMRKLPSRDELLVHATDVDQKLSNAHAVLRATYKYPYQMHGSIGASCAVADVKDGHVTVWSATQSVYPVRSIVAMLLNVSPDIVRVIYVRGSGCYGINGSDAVSFDAALLSQAVNRPVRVQLSRQDEMAWENFGAACVIDQRAAVDASGAISVWDCENWVASRGSRTGYDRPGNVITGLLAGYEPEMPAPRTASEPTRELRNRSNFVPSYMAGCVGEKCAGAGTVRSERVLTHTVVSPFFTGPLRSPLRIQNTFAHECFMDELCTAAKSDPIEFRLKHLKDERIIGVLRRAASVAQWKPRRPKAPKKTTGILTGRGVACVAYEGNNGYAALIAEVSVDPTTGRVQPTRFVLAHDCGPISNPDGLRNQIEGGILQGMSRALLEQVTWDDHRITSVDWESYNSFYLDIELPAIEIALLNRPDVSATGAGETAITLVAAAIGNAIFDATGARLREVPFTTDRMKAALAART